jgi:CHASE3 domain sensor protein
MGDDDPVRALLREIRDAQREHLAEYRRVTAQSLALQERAIERQQQITALYRRVLLVGGTVVTALVCLLAYLLVRWSHRLF